MYYNIDIKFNGQLIRKVTKVNKEMLSYWINQYITDDNEIIITSTIYDYKHLAKKSTK
jgi:hypothetical protein